MAPPRDLGAVIGERRLTTVSARPQLVTVTLARPRRPKGSQDWECPFRIAGAGIRVFEYGHGIDAIQAIATALQGIRHFLDKSGKSFAWEGTRMDDGGFQRSIPWFGDSRLTRRLERLVDAELKRNVAGFRRRPVERQPKKALRAVSSRSAARSLR